MSKLDPSMLDQLTAECKTPGDVAALYSQMLQRVINRGLDAEMDAHLGYARHEKADTGARPNRRNGAATKTLKGTFGELAITTPRDGEATFEPQLIRKRQTRLGTSRTRSWRCMRAA